MFKQYRTAITASLLCCALHLFANPDSLVLNTNFGTAGASKFKPIGYNANIGNADLLIEPDGKLVGFVVVQDSTDINLKRLTIFKYLSNGNLDNGFNGTGFNTVDIGLTNFALINAVRVSNGNYYLLFTGGNLLKINADLIIDANFGSNGMLSFMGNYNNLMYNVNTDHLLLTGQLSSSYIGLTTIIDLDGNTLNGISYDPTNLATDNINFYTALQLADSSVWAFGVIGNPYSRYAKSTFGVQFSKAGIITNTITFPFQVSIHLSSVLLNNERDIMLSSVSFDESGENNHIALFKMNTDGIYDTAYGYQLVHTERHSALKFNLVKNDSLIYGWGSLYKYDPLNGSVASFLRLDANGNIDSNFCEDGFMYHPKIDLGVAPPLYIATNRVQDINAFAIKADGTIYTLPAPFYGNGNTEIVIASYKSNLIPTGINNVQPPIQFRVYPNPANNLITISSNNTIGNYTITNSIGKMVASQTTTNINTSIDISHLEVGIYFISVGGNTTKFSKLQ